MGEGLLSVQRMLCTFDVMSQSSLDSMFDIGFFGVIREQSMFSHFHPIKGHRLTGISEFGPEYDL